MSDEADELIARVAESLKPLPKVDANAKALVLVAVAAERQRERERARRVTGRRWWRATAGALVAAVVMSVVWVRAARNTPAVQPAGDVAMVDTIRQVAPPSVLRASIERYLCSP